MLKKILIGVAAFVAAFVVFVMVQPSSYHVERSVQIQAPPEVVWAEVSDFGRWEDWSHWAKSDPEQKVTLGGEPGAVGHSSSWEGEKTGTGTMTITESEAPEHLGIRLEFFSPMAGVASTDMNLTSKGDAVEVTWTMDGENDFMGKLFGVFMSMDEMIGSAYEESLASLAQIATEEAAKQAETATAAAPSEPTPEEGEGQED